MHSSVNNRDTSTSIISIKEIIGIVIIFSLVLYLVFPKGDIDEIIKEKGKNTKLSINYLESMLLYYPDSIKLQMVLIKNYDYAGKIEKALKLTREVISKTDKKNELDKLYKIEYILMRDRYFKKEDRDLREEMREKLFEYFDFTSGRRDYMFLLAEAEQMDFTNLKYISVNGLMRQRPELEDYVFEKKSFYLAQTLGYKDEAYYSLLKLIEYEEAEDEIQKYALSSLIEREKYEKAKLLATKLFMKSNKRDEAISFFNIAIYTSTKNPESGVEEIEKLVELYQGDKILNSEDIHTILKTLLEVGHLKGTTAFAMKNFNENADAFDMKSIDLAIDSLIYNSQLKDAMQISRYAYAKFKKQKYLDKEIKISTWLGDIDTLIFLNKQGYREYKDLKYERYLLTSTTMDLAYEIRGEIYKSRVEKGDYSFVDKLAEYYSYTGEISKGEEYFFRLLRKNKNKKILKQAIEFAYYNSHFRKGLNLYEEYKKRYGIEKDLQQHSIEKLLALKDFKKAYRYTKELKEKKVAFNQRVLTDLLSINMDYPYLYTTLWEKEQKTGLVKSEYEKLLPLEKEFNRGKKVAYLYRKLWEKTSMKTYLLALLYLYMNKKNFNGFKDTIDRLSTDDKSRLNKSIEYNILMANYFIHEKETKKALKRFEKALKLSPYRAKTYQAYLWFLMDNHINRELKKVLRFLRENPELQKRVGLPSVVGAVVMQKNKLSLRWLKALQNSDNLFINRVIATLDTGDRAEAYSLTFRGLAENSRDIELYKIFYAMVNRDYPKAEFKSKWKSLSSNIYSMDSKISYRWRMYKGIEVKIIARQKKFIREKKKSLKDNSLLISLKNSNKRLLWNFSLERHSTKDDYISSSLDLKYKLSDLTLALNSKYQNQTEQTVPLQLNGMESSLEFKIQKPLSNRVNIALATKVSQYKKQDGSRVGNSNHLQISSNYILRAGYPDINFNTYLGLNRYSLAITDSFYELGTQLSLGANSKSSFNRSWRPFATVGLGVNSKEYIGTNLSLGLSGMLLGGDILSLSFDYSQGMGVVSEPVYGGHLNYRF